MSKKKDRKEIKQIFRTYKDHLNDQFWVSGWVRTNRGSKNFGFIELNDGSFFKNVQIVYDETLVNFDEVSKISTGSSVSVYGTLVETPNAKQDFELKAEQVMIENSCDTAYPLQKKRHSMEFLREIAHLRPRTNTFSAVFRIRSMVAYAIHQFFQERNFVYTHTPIITGSDCEGAGDMFQVTTLDLSNVPKNENKEVDFTQDFFGKATNLTVSGQLEAEAYALAFGKVYTFGPTFRSENSNTSRHASEFWMIEPEVAFADLEDNMDLAEEMIKYIIAYVLENAPEEMAFFNQFMDKGLIDRLEKLVAAEFQRVTYTKAVEILESAKADFQYPVKWGIDLQTEHERYLTEKHFKKPVFVTDYPRDIKSFYMRDNEDGKTVAAMDLLVPGVGEIIGGSQREERYEILLDKIKTMGLDEADYGWYLDLRKYGSVVHSGYGLGFERIIMYLTGISNIRDVLPFPRTPKSAEF